MIKSVYQNLLNQYGHKNWWPARSNSEVMVGAILTQNTGWNNVEKAINNLTNENLLDADEIVNIKLTSLAKTIKPSGYFNIKANRLQAFFIVT